MAERPARAPDWLTISEALERILGAVAPLPTEMVPLDEAYGRVLAESVASPIHQPPWDNSAMDGYAARAEDVRGARDDAPAVLRVVGEVAAGAFPSRAVGSGEVVRIMTGAPVPEGADSVIRLEHTMAVSDERVAVLDDSDAGRNIRPRGEDLVAGKTVLEPGRMLRPAEIGLLSTMGRQRVRVHRRPRVAILSNGDELVDLDRYEEVLAGRRIVNSNAYALAAAVRAAGGTPLPLGIARDEAASLRALLEQGAGADALVTTAGASVGDHDIMKDVLEELGFSLGFWRVKIRPGSPFSFGTWHDTAVFGLPGNPVSALVTFEVLVRPALRRMVGRRDVHAATLRVRAAERIESRPGLVRFLRARLEADGKGGWLARLTGPQGSGILSSMAEADALLVIPLDVERVEKGATLTALPLRGADDARAEPGF